MQINGLFILLHLYFTYVYPESDIECSIKLLLIKGGGSRSTDPRSQSKFADRVFGELIPQMQALNLLENKIICST